MATLNIRPALQATLVKRTAYSACCGARLDAGPLRGVYICRACGQACERKLSDGEVITAHG